MIYYIQYFANIVRQVMEVFGQQTKAGTKDSIKIAAQVISLFIAKIAKLGYSGICFPLVVQICQH